MYSIAIQANNNKNGIFFMTRARSELIDLSATSYYHCINRCVRRAFLCGNDRFSGKNYEHRKTWVIDRLSELTVVFSVEVCAYAVMTIFCSCKDCIHYIPVNIKSLSSSLAGKQRHRRELV